MGKGQITVFMLLGILILIAGVLWFIPRESSLQKTEVAITDVEGTRAAVQALAGQYEQCVKERAEELLVLFGLEGGDLSVVHYGSSEVELPVQNLYNKGRSMVPSIDKWEKTLSNALSEIAERCAGQLQLPVGVSINKIGVNAAVHIAAEQVVLVVGSPGILVGENVQSALGSVTSSLPIRLGRMHTSVINVVNELIRDPNLIPYSLLLDQGFTIDVVKREDYFFLYSLEDPLSLAQNQPYKFVWGALYGTETSVNYTRPRILNGGLTLKPKMGIPFRFQVLAHAPAGSRMTFLDNTNLFQINEATGVIQFTPIADQLGIHEVTIGIIASNGEDTSEKFLFIVAP